MKGSLVQVRYTAAVKVGVNQIQGKIIYFGAEGHVNACMGGLVYRMKKDV